MSGVDTATAIGIAISIVAIVVSIVVFIRQGRAAREQATISNAQPVAVDLFREFRDLGPRRWRVSEELGSEASTTTFDSIADEELREAALLLCHWYDNVGMLVAHNMVNPEFIAGLIGTSAIGTWHLLEPVIREERRRRNGPYQEYFEYLVRVRFEGDLRPDDVRRRVMPALYELRESEKWTSSKDPPGSP